MTNWIGVQELCLHLGISKETVYRMVKKASIPFYRVGRHVRFDIDEVDAAIKKGKLK